jgi:hypothetical protein
LRIFASDGQWTLENRVEGFQELGRVGGRTEEKMYRAILELGVVVRTCNPSTKEAEGREL